MDTYAVEKTFVPIRRCSTEDYDRLADAWEQFCKRHENKFTPGLHIGEMQSVNTKHVRHLLPAWFRSASHAVKIDQQYRPQDIIAIHDGILGTWRVTEENY